MKDYKEKMVKDYQKPEKCYAEKFDQAPLRYMERQDKMQAKEAKKIRQQMFEGRYK